VNPKNFFAELKRQNHSAIVCDSRRFDSVGWCDMTIFVLLIL